MASQNDDVGALFKSIGADRNSYRELTRSADAADSEERWPLLKSIPPERRQSPPPLSKLAKNQIWNSQENSAPRDRAAPRNFTGLGEKLAKSLMKITEGNLPFASSNAQAARSSDGYRDGPSGQVQQKGRGSEPRFEAADSRERRRPNSQFGAAPPAQQFASAERPAEAPMFQSRIEQRGPAYAPTQERAKESERRGYAGQAATQSRPVDSGRGMFSNYVAPQPAGPANAGRGLFAAEPAAQSVRRGGKGLFARETPAPARQAAANPAAADSLQTIFKSLESEPENTTPSGGNRTAIMGRLNRR
jgi:hypothetical protein